MTQPSAGEIPVTVRFRVRGEDVAVTAHVPAQAARIDQVLPLVAQIDDQAIDRAVAHSQAEGRPISCCRGCAACCKAQPVPVTPVEAYALARLVDSLPEPRQAEVRRRFAERAEALHAAGLADVFLRRRRDLSQDDARQVAERYMTLRLACPFLEDDACSIYHQRPLVCRQYLVTSPREWCHDPLHNPVEVLPVPLAAAGAMLAASSRLLEREQFTVPLVLALEYAAAHRAELEQTFEAQAVVDQCLRALFAAEPAEESKDGSS